MCTTGNSIPFVTMSTVLWKGSNLSGVDICLPENSDNCPTKTKTKNLYSQINHTLQWYREATYKP
jgi:hypothetical protein